MNRLIIIFIFLWFCAFKAIGQNNLPRTFEITTDTTEWIVLPDSAWQVLYDREGKWGIEQVSQSPIKDKFSSNSTRINGVDYTLHFFWLRYRIKNTLKREIKICLTNATNADQSDFYLSHETRKWSHYVTGTLYPYDKKDGLKRIDKIPIQVQPGEVIMVYNRLKNFYFINKPKFLYVCIGFTDNIIRENYVNDESNFTYRDFDAIFTGILLFACIFSLFFYSIVKNKVYLYYALFLFYFFFDRDFLIDFVFPAHPFILFVIEALIKSSGIFLFVQFIRYFLKTFNRFPDWDKALRCISIIQPIGFLLNFFISPYLTGKWDGTLETFADFLFDTGLFMILITFLKFLNKSDRLATVLIISAIPASLFWAIGFTITSLFSFLYNRFGIEAPSFVNWLYSRFNVLNGISVIWLVVSFSWVLLLQFVQLRKENAQQALDKERLAKEKEIERSQLIEQQKIDLERMVELRTAELKHSFENLKSTQEQLIHSEKMASLGELAAGIAHEIQNPLNFMNNFSEVNAELLGEMRDEIENGNLNEANAIANHIIENEEKISHHGKRADAIVKGMLQHSRTSSGQNEPTDINALADEYLRLSYHGLRAKEKSFNATMVTDYDQTISNINIIPQDIGRVLLNLYNNAFYAVSEKNKQLLLGYEPTVSVSTCKSGNKVEIRIRDNGNGISSKVKGKIFQPFFTTKPTGQGTGLGLSLSYDIIKVHGGEIKVETREGEFTEFVILIPVV
jgi:two-component system, NtrC family, sensor kinase